MSTNTVIDIKDVEHFNQLSSKETLMVCHFTADWAPQCQQVSDVLVELARNKDYQSVIFAKVVAEDAVELSKRMNVTSVPTCVLFSKSKELVRIEGADVPQLTTQVKQLAFKLGSNVGITSSEESNNIEERLKTLMSRSPVMVFMKGSPDAPRCGFSRTLVSILNEVNAKYDTFDILSDEEVRQQLKVLSNWPTYPQVYVKGQLIGGLDIIKELKESGELEDALKG